MQVSSGNRKDWIIWNLSLPNLSAGSGNSVRAATCSPFLGLESENNAWKQIQQLLPGLSTVRTSKNSHRINVGSYLLCVVFHEIHSKFSANTELRTKNTFFWDSGSRKNYSRYLSELILCLNFPLKRKWMEFLGFKQTQSGWWFQVTSHGCQQQRKQIYRDYRSQPECYPAVSGSVSFD